MKVLWMLIFVAVAANAVEYENECPPEQESDWEIEKLLRHPDCDKFYQCTLGQPVVMRCYEGLYFNLETWQCDWKENVDCTDRNIPDPEPEPEPTPEPTPEATTPEPTTPEPTTPEPTTPEPTTPEPTTPEPTTPEPTTPEPTTPEPTTPEPTTPEPTTPEPTTPEPTTPEPTTPEPTTELDCETEPEPEPTPAPQPQPTPEPDFLENGCPVDPHIHWLLPHEEDCNLFYYCVWGAKVLRQCPETLYFNRLIQVCDWPSNAGCPTSINKHIESRHLIMRGFK